MPQLGWAWTAVLSPSRPASLRCRRGVPRPTAPKEDQTIQLRLSSWTRGSSSILGNDQCQPCTTGAHGPRSLRLALSLAADRHCAPQVGTIAPVRCWQNWAWPCFLSSKVIIHPIHFLGSGRDTQDNSARVPHGLSDGSRHPAVEHWVSQSESSGKDTTASAAQWTERRTAGL